MAARKITKSKGVKKAAKKTVKKTARKSAKKAAAAPKIREGLVAHTELASADPAATKAWAQKVLGWKFGPSMPTPTGDYHMWDAGNRTGGGIRANMAPEMPGSIPYVETADIKKTVARALKAGAKPMMPPASVGEGMGWIAIVLAPGGVPMGLWAPK